MIRLYLDEDAMRRSLVLAVRARNVDVVTAADASMINRLDQDHLALATSLDRTLYTYNISDYCLLHQGWLAAETPHAGIVVVTQQRYSVGEELRLLMRLVSGTTQDEMRNRIEFLSSWA